MDSSTFELTASSPSGDHPLKYLAFVPASAPLTPPLVLVHGNNRASARLFRAFLPLAAQYNIPLIAPRFSRNRFPSYQQLAGEAGPYAARTALDVALDDVQTTLGINTELVDLMGFSGGAQFAHRYAMVASDRVVRVVAASAGWYTFLDAERPFPRGSAALEPDPRHAVDAAAFLRIPILVLVGERDTLVDESLRSSAWLVRQQGANRVERAGRWVQHLQETAALADVAPRAKLDTMVGVGHSLAEAIGEGNLVGRTIEFLHPLAISAAARPSSDPDEVRA